MRDERESQVLRMDARRRIAAESLKRCPLCNAINSIHNEECFVCTWRGEFDHDPEHVDQGLGELLVQCPELADAILETPPSPLGFVGRCRLFFRRVRSRMRSRRTAAETS